jgi:hypothetical protein
MGSLPIEAVTGGTFLENPVGFINIIRDLSPDELPGTIADRGIAAQAAAEPAGLRRKVREIPPQFLKLPGQGVSLKDHTI